MENVVSVEDDYHVITHERGHREPFENSMLDEDALTTVEHLEFPEFAIEDGENVIFTILEARYPDKDPIDRASKALFDVFRPAKGNGLRAVG